VNGETGIRDQGSETEKAKSIEAEVHLDGDHDRNGRFAVLHCGPEFVLPNCFDRLLVQPHPERSHNMNIHGVSLRIDDEGDEANALIMCAPRFIRVLCCDRMLDLRGADVASDFVNGLVGLGGSCCVGGRGDLLGGGEGNQQEGQESDGEFATNRSSPKLAKKV
jgi:hypothetical protein